MVRTGIGEKVTSQQVPTEGNLSKGVLGQTWPKLSERRVRVGVEMAGGEKGQPWRIRVLASTPYEI